MHVSNPSDTTFFIILYLLVVWLGLNICMKIVRLCREIRASNDYHKMSDASLKSKRKQADCIVWSKAFVWRFRTDFTLNKSSLHSIITQRSPVSSVYLTFFPNLFVLDVDKVLLDPKSLCSKMSESRGFDAVWSYIPQFSSKQLMLTAMTGIISLQDGLLCMYPIFAAYEPRSIACSYGFS